MRKLLLLCLLLSQSGFASYDFDGSSEFAGTYGTGLTYGFTIGCYIKYANHPGSDDHIMNFGVSPSSENDSIMMGLFNPDDYRLQTRNSGGGDEIATYSAGSGEYDGTWHGVIIKISSATVRVIYVGALANSTTDGTASNVQGTLDEVTVGDSAAGGSDFVDNIAECFVYDGSISDADITSYMSGTQPNCLAGSANVAGYWSFATDDSTADDESGNGGPTLTLSGSAAFDADHPTMTDCAGSPLRRRR